MENHIDEATESLRPVCSDISFATSLVTFTAERVALYPKESLSESVDCQSSSPVFCFPSRNRNSI